MASATILVLVITGSRLFKLESKCLRCLQETLCITWVNAFSADIPSCMVCVSGISASVDLLRLCFYGIFIVESCFNFEKVFWKLIWFWVTHNSNRSGILRFFAGKQVLVNFIFYVAHNLGNASSDLIPCRFKEFLVLGIVDLTALNAAALEGGA